MKRIVCVAILIIFSVSMVCAGGQKEADTEDQITLNVFNYFDATAPGYAEEQAIWEEFMNQNPNVTIVREELSNEPFHQKMAAYIAAGTMPDVMYMYPSGRSTSLHEMKLVKDLQPLLGAEYLSHFVPAALDISGQSGGYLAELPQSICYTTVMIANTKLLDEFGLEIPKTYDELKAMVPLLKAKGVQTLLMANKDDWVMQSCLFSTIAGRFVGNEWIDKAKTGDVKFTDKEFIEALAFVATMYKDGVIDQNTIQIPYGEAPALFASGKAAFFINGDWQLNAFITDPSSGTALIDPASQDGDFEIINFPAIPNEKNPGTTSTILGCGYGISVDIPAGSKKEDAAVRLVKYLYSPEVQKHYLEIGRYVTSRNDVTSDTLEPLSVKLMAYQKTIDSSCYVLDGILVSEVYTVLNSGLQEIGLGVKTPEQVGAEIQAAMDACLASK